MKNKKPTVTIGIPAHNEEANIKNMIESVLKQRGESFVLEKILVVLDGCTDNTLKIVKSIAKKDRRIKVLNDGKRTGKATRLNQILTKNNSDFVFLIDADIVLARSTEIERMILEFVSNKKINVVAGYQIPTHANTFIGKISNASFNLWYDTTTNINEGSHIYNLHGSMSGLRKSFADSFRFSKNVICDAGFLYKKAVSRNKQGFKLAKTTRVLFNAVNTLYDMRLQGARSIYGCKINMIEHFGKEEMLKEYKISTIHKIRAVTKSLINDPFYTIFALIVGIYIRLFPLKDKFIKNGFWEISSSSKAKIKIIS